MPKLPRIRRKDQPQTPGPNGQKSHSDIYEIEEFFEDDDRPGLAYPKLARWIIILTALFFLLWIILAFSLPKHPPQDFSLFWMSYEWAEKVTDFVLIVVTLLISLLASVLAVALINKGNLAKIKFIKHITHRDAVKAVLTNLQGYNGRYSKSKQVELVFEGLKTAADGYQAIKVTQTVHVRMRFMRKELILDFVTLERDNEANGNESVNYDLQSDSVPDDAHSIDITDIRRHFPDEVDGMFPGLVEVIINSEPHRVEPEFVNGNENHRRWRINTAKHVGGRLVDVFYRYSFHQELTGYAYQELTEPTQGFFYSLNYEGVAGKISAYRIGNLNARQAGQDVGGSNVEVDNKLEVSTSEWVIPNSTVAYCWYAKPQPEGPAADDAKDGAAVPAAGSDDKPGEDGAPAEVPAPGGQPAPPERSAPGDALAELEKGLKVDGNCLGLALLDVFAALGRPAPAADYAQLSTPADAVGVLKQVEGIEIELASRASAFERWLMKAQARRFGLPYSDGGPLAPGEIALCKRSMRQLYGLRRVEAHWVVVTGGEAPKLLDRLAGLVMASFDDVHQEDARSVLDQKDVTFRIRAI